MMDMVTIDNSETVFDSIVKRFWGIPFDNSNFQVDNFIINSSLTPERAYRAAALRLQSRLEALKEVKFKAMKNDVKKRKLKHQIENEKDPFEKELLEIELMELSSSEIYSAKLVNDAIVEANHLYKFIQSCPEYTREDFENAERIHYEKRLLQEAQGVTGALKSLADMGVDMDALSKGKLQYKEQEDALQLR